jgi:hypothetical protein
MKDLKKYINGFENGWFSTKHLIQKKICSNASSISIPFTENNIMMKWVGRGNLYLSDHLRRVLAAPILTEEVIEEDLNTGFRKTLKTHIKWKDYMKKFFNIDCHVLKMPHDTMWFLVWGDGRFECYGSKGDGSAFYD